MLLNAAVYFPTFYVVKVCHRWCHSEVTVTTTHCPQEVITPSADPQDGNIAVRGLRKYRNNFWQALYTIFLVGTLCGHTDPKRTLCLVCRLYYDLSTSSFTMAMTAVLECLQKIWHACSPGVPAGDEPCMIHKCTRADLHDPQGQYWHGTMDLTCMAPRTVVMHDLHDPPGQHGSAEFLGPPGLCCAWHGTLCMLFLAWSNVSWHQLASKRTLTLTPYQPFECALSSTNFNSYSMPTASLIGNLILG